jgi:diguanylate cyclase (GGDEF)-like protein/PAS domain S-box-containing protein
MLYPEPDGTTRRMVVSTFTDISERKRQEFEVARLAAIVESASEAIVTVTTAGIVMSWNSGAEKLYGYSSDEMLGRNIATMCTCIEDVRYVRDAWTRIDAGQQIPAFETKRLAKDGTLIDISLALSPVRDSRGRVVAISGIHRDIREQKRMIEELRRSEERLEETQRLVGLGSFEIDLATMASTWSDAMFSMIGVPIENGPLAPMEYLQLVHPDERDFALAQFRRLMADGTPYQADCRIIAPNGREIVLQTRTKVEFANGRPVRVRGSVLDVTERKRIEKAIEEYNVALQNQMADLAAANKMLEALSTTDGLTGLRNHRIFQERLREEYYLACRHKTELSVAMIDVDRFKSYNDEFGHPAGDVVLAQVATLIQSCARDTDIVARYGGEEFVIILPITDERGTACLAERIRRKVEQYRWPLRSITVSIGCASMSSTTDDSSELIVMADRALYQSKTAGRNRVTMSSPLHEADEDDDPQSQSVNLVIA